MRQQAEDLEDRLKARLTLLADTRSELLERSNGDRNVEARSVPVDELLAYAQRIANTTLPAHHRTQQPPILDKATSKPKNPAPHLNGNTSNTPFEEQTTNEPNAQIDGIAGRILAADEGASGNTNELRVVGMQDMKYAPWVPWPSDEIARSGALAHIQNMLEAGTDPGSILSKEQQDAEIEERRQAEAKAREQEERERLERERRRQAAAEAARREAADEAPQTFGGLDLYNPEDDEE